MVTFPDYSYSQYEIFKSRKIYEDIKIFIIDKYKYLRIFLPGTIVVILMEDYLRIQPRKLPDKMENSTTNKTLHVN